ncbi:threonine/homoserine/homoserine lactone efflux protein [Phytomonospora endophytica]|uniref:Threonine/homoserine/homoserine lactone efflux protein n=2 Tax=Phytomonospora endophytica TaxID=714109 RepID=A0A841FRZ4_9ACTN|nr:LysE family translocator [Phytomonospora endophytica]MBB6036322.1 threonine/homoserine/homoserine lactone efflux protein [Phytomonospora endophytica]GIG67229.1 lysine transporter LysE [Phytomonospora endophytica]
MISLHAALGIAAISLGMVLTPGPNMIYLVSRSITQGRRAGLISLGGVAVGFVVYVIATAAGLAAVFALVPAVYTALKIAGAGYLLYLAWQALKPGGKAVFAPKDLPVDSPRKLFTMGLVTNLLNPKIAILYVSLLPQFIDPEGAPVALQSLELGLVQITIAITVNGLIAMGAGSIARFLGKRPLWMRAQRWVMGTVLAALALKLATDRTKAVAA